MAETCSLLSVAYHWYNKPSFVLFMTEYTFTIVHLDMIYTCMLQIYKAICNKCIRLWLRVWKIFVCMCGYIHGTNMSMATCWHFTFCTYHMIPVWSPSCLTPYLNLTFTTVPWFLEILYTLNCDHSWPTVCQDIPRSFLRIRQQLSWSQYSIILWDVTVHYSIHNGKLLYPVLRQMNPVLVLITHFC
jgi:hypothetical protein